MGKFFVVVFVALVFLCYLHHVNLTEPRLAISDIRVTGGIRDAGRLGTEHDRETIGKAVLTQKKEHVDRVFHEMDQEVRKLRRL